MNSRFTHISDKLPTCIWVSEIADVNVETITNHVHIEKMYFFYLMAIIR